MLLLGKTQTMHSGDFPSTVPDLRPQKGLNPRRPCKFDNRQLVWTDTVIARGPVAPTFPFWLT